MLHVFLFISVYSSAVILSILSNPIFAFVGYEIVYFFYPSNRWWGEILPDVSYSFFTVLLMFVVILLNYKMTKTNKILTIPPFKWLLFVLFLYSIASFYAVAYEQHIIALTYFSKLVVIILLAYKLCDTDLKLDYAMFGYLFGTWYLSFYIFQIGRNSGNRVEGIGTVDSPDANGTAATLVPGLVIALYYFWLGKNKYIKIAMLLVAVFIINALILINSRGAFLGAVFGIVYFLLYMYSSKLKENYQKLKVILIIICGLAGSLYLTDDSFIERIFGISQQVVETDGSIQTGATRMYFWLAAWEMAKDYPFGNGYRGFDYYAYLYIPEGINTGGSLARSVHSSWFEALTEIGYIGFGAFLFMIYSTFKILRLCKKKLKTNKEIELYYKIIAIEGALISFLITMSFMNRMRAEILYWLILFACCAYNIYILKYKQE